MSAVSACGEESEQTLVNWSDDSTKNKLAKQKMMHMMCGQTQNALQLTNNSCCRRASRRNAPSYSPRPACPFPCGRWRRCPWACHCCWWRMIFRYRRFASYSSEGRQERWKTQRPRRRRPSATRAGQRAPCRAIGPRRGAAGGGPWLRWFRAVSSMWSFRRPLLCDERETMRRRDEIETRRCD